MLDIVVFEKAPQPIGDDTDGKTDTLINWFRTTYPEREDIGSEELYRSARDYVLIYC